MGPGLFWGVLLILIGLAAIFKVVFDVNLFGVVFALFLIFLGISMLVGKPWMFHRNKGPHDTMFEDRTVREQPADHSEYNVIFGKSVYDFTSVDFPDERPVHVKINTIFGHSVVQVDRKVPVIIKSDAVFGSASMPDGSSVSFGSLQYSSDAYHPDSVALVIEAPVVFGAVQVVTTDVSR